MKIKNIIIPMFVFVILIGIVAGALSVSLADHGSNIRNKSSGVLLDSSDLRVEVYDALNGGNLVYSS